MNNFSHCVYGNDDCKKCKKDIFIKRGDIYFVCEQCGADVQENLIDQEKSNENWKVKKEKCPFCGGNIIFKIK